MPERTMKESIRSPVRRISPWHGPTVHIVEVPAYIPAVVLG
jgi:hypothetical protein